MAKHTTKVSQDMTPEELQAYYQSLSDDQLGAMSVAAKTEKERRDVEQIRSAKRAGAIASIPVNILKSVAAIAQTVTGIKALKGLKPPAPPAPPERDVQLLERLREARLEAEQPVTPAMQRAREAQAVEAAGRGRATARAATAGQLGLYAPLAQATNLGILKQMRAGVQEDEALRIQRQQIFDRLLQQRAQETTQIQRSKERGFYGYEYPEFQAQRGAYAGLAQTGISGMLDILGGIPEMATAFAAGRRTPEPTLAATPLVTPPALPQQGLFPEEQPEYFSPY